MRYLLFRDGDVFQVISVAVEKEREREKETTLRATCTRAYWLIQISFPASSFLHIEFAFYYLLGA